MAIAFTAWLRAPAPTTCTSTAPVWRTTPAMAPATELGFERLDTLRISTGPSRRAGCVSPRKFDSPVDASCPPLRPFSTCLSYARCAFDTAERGGQEIGLVGRSVEGDRLVVGVGLGVGVGIAVAVSRRVRRRGQTCCLADALGGLDQGLEVFG